MPPRRPTEPPLIPPPDSAAAEPLYLQVVQRIEDGIRAGRLRVGQRLPAERALAAELGVSRTTVTGAYQELEARGLLRGHVGRGTLIVGAPPGSRSALPWSQRVSGRALRAAPVSFGVPRPRGDVIAFDSGWPDPHLYPVEALEDILERLPGRGTTELYASAPPPGDPRLREAVAGWLTSRGIPTHVEDVLITAGAQQAINVLARAFLGPGDVVLTEATTFQCALVALRWAGAEVVGVPMDHEGILPDALEEALERYRPKLAYLIPTFHNPTGAVLGRERRHRVLELAGRYRLPVVESDLYGELYFEEPPPPRLKALDAGGLVVYMGSFSKIGVPGLRIGWLAAPSEAIGPLTLAKEFVDLHLPALTQRLAAGFIAGSHLERHLGVLRAECRLRRDALVTALRQQCPGLRFRIPSGGYYVWAQLPAPVTTVELLPEAAEQGVVVRPGPQFTPGGGGEDHIRLCFASLEPRAITEGIRRLGTALE
ncbi:MAG: PLP-dependent aminotransferase family protein, partial [Candidatus Rokuibacteriota bacterium]